MVTHILANQWCTPSKGVILSTFSLAISVTRLSILKTLWRCCPNRVTGSFTFGCIPYHWSIRAISLSPLFHEVEFIWIWLRDKNSSQHIFSWNIFNITMKLFTNGYLPPSRVSRKWSLLICNCFASILWLIIAKILRTKPTFRAWKLRRIL